MSPRKRTKADKPADPEHSTVLRHKRQIGGYWFNPGGERGDLVFDRTKINGAHLWLDPATFGRPNMMVSAEFAESLAAAKFSSVQFRPFRLF